MRSDPIEPQIKTRSLKVTHFKSKWAEYKKTPSHNADGADSDISTVSNVSNVNIRISGTGGLNSQWKLLSNRLFEFLNGRVELVPLGFCLNECTYWANDAIIFSELTIWLREKGFQSISLKVFRELMLGLFPEPHAQFIPAGGEWWGFRFHKSMVNEKWIVIHRKALKE